MKRKKRKTTFTSTFNCCWKYSKNLIKLDKFYFRWNCCRAWRRWNDKVTALISLKKVLNLICQYFHIYLNYFNLFFIIFWQSDLGHDQKAAYFTICWPRYQKIWLGNGKSRCYWWSRLTNIFILPNIISNILKYFCCHIQFY